ELISRIRVSQFRAKIIVPRYVKTSSLYQFMSRRLGGKELTASGWFTVDVPALADVIRYATEYLVQESEVEEEIGKIEQKVDSFVQSLKGRGVYKRVYDVMYKLYGMQSPTDEEIVFSQAALSLLLTATFYERIRNAHPQLSPLGDYIERHEALEGFKMALDDLMRIDYEEAIKLAREILDALPSDATLRVKELAEEGIRIAQNRALLRRDFAGRVYHKITGDMAVRKGFATFYTTVPAAYLLSTLAVRSLLGLEGDLKSLADKVNMEELISRAQGIKVADFACGSGTLLTASYSALMHTLIALAHYKGSDVDFDWIGKRIIEDGIYGVDALKYASQIAAINLALVGPRNILKENVHTIYLGYIKDWKQAWLGSLELLRNGRSVGGLWAWVDDGLSGIVDRMGLHETEGKFEIPDRFDLVIMNPPFTRATGRAESFESESSGGRGLFGFIADESARKVMLEAYEDLRERVRSDLIKLARSLAESENLPDVIRKIISGDGDEFRQYLSIGQAGEGLLFLYLAYRYVRPGGVIAFVLPRNVLSGVSWFLARALLAGKFHVKYIIVSSDAENGYNFSEGTSLSEALIVARRVDSHEPNEETKFVVLTNKPKTTVEAAVLADKLLSGSETAYSGALVRSVSRSALLNTVINWNTNTIPDDKLVSVVEGVISDGKIRLCDASIGMPVTYFNNLIEDMGVNRGGDIIEAFNLPRRGNRVECGSLSKDPIPGSVPMLCSGEEWLRKTMLIKPNAWVVGNGPKAERIIRLRSRLLVSDRIRWDTWRLIAVYSDEPLIANRFFMVKLRDNDENKEKALAVWLNTTFGLLTVYANREETEGAFTRLNIGQWKALPVLDVSKLGDERTKALVSVFAEYANKEFRRIPEQYGENPDPVRLSFDLDFLKALNPSIDVSRAEKCLRDLYARLGIALRAWIESG
ncbi:MAG: hypothetical protein ACP5LW_06650, partial [Nitrososphaeria archaeon]